MTALVDRPHWVFDLDGTLTKKVHDFPAIKRELGLPPDEGILEAMESLQPAARARVAETLEVIEWRLAADATAAVGALDLLDRLARRGMRLGIVTRNRRAIALRTLEAAGLSTFFDTESVIGRDEAPPKPDSEGVRRLLRSFDAWPGSAVMVGDHRHDLVAGRGAGALTIYVDESGEFPFRDVADLWLVSLADISRDHRI